MLGKRWVRKSCEKPHLGLSLRHQTPFGLGATLLHAYATLPSCLCSTMCWPWPSTLPLEFRPAPSPDLSGQHRVLVCLWSASQDLPCSPPSRTLFPHLIREVSVLACAVATLSSHIPFPCEAAPSCCSLDSKRETTMLKILHLHLIYGLFQSPDEIQWLTKLEMCITPS